MKEDLSKSVAGIVRRAVPSLILGAVLAVGGLAVATSAWSAVVGIDIDVAPPPPRYEPVPAVPPGYVWAPGYWEWVHGTHVWRRGHLVAGRPGYHWVPDHWEDRGGRHHYEPGRWER
ncbi:MAG: hypothetical protein ABSF50_16490 [Burkholderiaceae bacterium]|jgi:hypothetical protein